MIFLFESLESGITSIPDQIRFHKGSSNESRTNFQNPVSLVPGLVMELALCEIHHYIS